jgi:hypothetical protein
MQAVRPVHTELTKQNRNKLELLSAHIQQNADIFWISAFSEQLQFREHIVWRCKGNGEDGNIRTPAAGFVRLASQISKEINKRRFWLKPTLSKGKACDDDEPLTDLRNDDTG